MLRACSTSPSTPSASAPSGSRGLDRRGGRGDRRPRRRRRAPSGRAPERRVRDRGGRLRRRSGCGDPPVIGIVRDGRLLLDARTLAPRRGRRGRPRRPPVAAGLDPHLTMALTVGTAGHVDHGKTTLVRALTGKDTDRLPEERARGISIDLGYAPLELPGGPTLSLVDVPGHERFVRTMVAGATGIDLFLLVVDAAEGARPQTHEHLAILRLLGVDHGVVAVTKADVVDEETLELARRGGARARPRRAGRPGQRRHRRRPRRASRRARRGWPPRRRAAPRRLPDPALRRPRLHAAGDRHGRDRDALVGGDRRGRPAAARAVGPRGPRPLGAGARRAGRAGRGGAARRGQPSRARARATCGAATHSSRAGAFPRSYRLEVALARARADRATARGSRCTTGRAASPRASCGWATSTRSFASLRPSSRPAATASSCGARRTVGGAVVLDPAPPRGRTPTATGCSTTSDPASIVRALVHAPVRVEAARRAAPCSTGRSWRRGSTPCGSSTAGRSRTRGSRRPRPRRRGAPRAPGPRQSPLDPGLALAELLPPRALGGGRARRCSRSSGAGAKVVLPGRRRPLGARAEAAVALEDALAAAGLAATKVEDGELARFLEAEGRARPPRRRLRRRAGRLRGRARPRRDRVRRAQGRSRSRGFRDLSGVGRRDAQLLLERMDVDGVTRRIGDRRVLRRASRATRARLIPGRRSCENLSDTFRGGDMAGKPDFTDEEWEDLRKGATGAGLLVSVSDRSFFDTFKEASSLAKHCQGIARQRQPARPRALLRRRHRLRDDRLAERGAGRDVRVAEGRGRDVALEGPRRGGELPRVRARARRVGRQGGGWRGRGGGRTIEKIRAALA